MSKKRKNRNNKKVLQALRQKRAAGGRLNKRNGGPSEEDIQRMIAAQAAKPNNKHLLNLQQPHLQAPEEVLLQWSRLLQET